MTGVVMQPDGELAADPDTVAADGVGDGADDLPEDSFGATLRIPRRAACPRRGERR